MPANIPLAVTGVVAVCVYYLFSWLLFGRDPNLGVLVPTYDPPRDLSPAMIRFVREQRFDDRTFWAGVLSLVAKQLATIEAEDGATRLRPVPKTDAKQFLPEEEQILLDRLVRGKPRSGILISMLDPHAMLAAQDMAACLRKGGVGRWFRENRTYVIGGVCLSVVATLLAAQPRNLQELGLLVVSFAMMALPAFYLMFLTMRAAELVRVLRERFDGLIFRRSAGVSFFMITCVAGIVLGAVVLQGTFGWFFVVVALFLTIVNVLQLQWMKAPTQEGAKLLTEIEGFRHFLESVERLPMARADAPSNNAGLYEKYLPYAIALEVEQAWSDHFVALANTFHQNAGIKGAESFYLGMWEGKPVEIMYKSQPPK